MNIDFEFHLSMSTSHCTKPLLYPSNTHTHTALDEHLNTNTTQEELKSSDVLESKPLDIPVDNTSDDESNPSRKLEIEREEELQGTVMADHVLIYSA